MKDLRPTYQDLMNQETHLGIYSIYNSFSGECGLIRPGVPTTFLRLTGCNLRCPYCDSMNAVLRKNEVLLDIEAAVQKTMHLVRKTNALIITGGEPLIQHRALSHFIPLLTREMYVNHNSDICVQIETNGLTHPHELINCVHCWVVDYKTTNANVSLYDVADNFTANISDTDFLINNFILKGQTFVKYVCNSEETIKVAFRHIKSVLYRFNQLVESSKIDSNVIRQIAPRFAIGVEHGKTELMPLLTSMLYQNDSPPIERSTNAFKIFGLIGINYQLHKLLGFGSTEEIPLSQKIQESQTH